MLKALVTVDPTSQKGKSFERFAAILFKFQQAGLIRQIDIGAMIHSSMYAVPLKWYRDSKAQFAEEAQQNIADACHGRFDYHSIKVLFSDSAANEDMVNQLTSYGRRQKCDVFVTLSHERSGLPYWLLGSFSETAALTAKMPVLIIKPQLTENALSKEPRLVVAVDPTAPVSRSHVRWLSKLAKPIKAQVDLIHVVEREGTEKDSTSYMRTLAQQFRVEGVSAKTVVLKSKESAAHAIAEFADKKKAWLTVTIGAERSAARKLLLGSTACRLLTLTERPFLSLRLE